MTTTRIPRADLADFGIDPRDAADFGIEIIDDEAPVTAKPRVETETEASERRRAAFKERERKSADAKAARSKQALPAALMNAATLGFMPEVLALTDWSKPWAERWSDLGADAARYRAGMEQTFEENPGAAAVGTAIPNLVSGGAGLLAGMGRTALGAAAPVAGSLLHHASRPLVAETARGVASNALSRAAVNAAIGMPNAMASAARGEGESALQSSALDILDGLVPGAGSAVAMSQANDPLSMGLAAGGGVLSVLGANADVPRSGFAMADVPSVPQRPLSTYEQAQAWSANMDPPPPPREPALTQQMAMALPDRPPPPTWRRQTPVSPTEPQLDLPLVGRGEPPLPPPLPVEEAFGPPLTKQAELGLQERPPPPPAPPTQAPAPAPDVRTPLAPHIQGWMERQRLAELKATVDAEARKNTRLALPSVLGVETALAEAADAPMVRRTEALAQMKVRGLPADVFKTFNDSLDEGRARLVQMGIAFPELTEAALAPKKAAKGAKAPAVPELRMEIVPGLSNLVRIAGSALSDIWARVEPQLRKFGLDLRDFLAAALFRKSVKVAATRGGKVDLVVDRTPAVASAEQAPVLQAIHSRDEVGTGAGVHEEIQALARELAKLPPEARALMEGGSGSINVEAMRGLSEDAWRYMSINDRMALEQRLANRPADVPTDVPAQSLSGDALKRWAESPWGTPPWKAGEEPPTTGTNAATPRALARQRAVAEAKQADELELAKLVNEPTDTSGSATTAKRAPASDDNTVTLYSGLDPRLVAAGLSSLYKHVPERWASALEQLPGKLKKWALLPEQRAATLPEAYAALRIAGARQLDDFVVSEMFGAYKRIEKKLPQASRALVQRFVNQSYTTPDPVRFTDLPEAVQNLWGPAIKRSQAQEDYLIARGVIQQSDEARRRYAFERDVGLSHMHREFVAMMDGSWRPPTDTVLAAMEHLTAKGKSAAEAEAIITDYLKTGTGRQPMGPNTPGELRQRTNIDPVLRKLLGEVRDAGFKVAQSAGQLERLASFERAAEQFTAPQFKETLWSDGLDGLAPPQMFPTRVGEGLSPEAGKRTYGSFYGKFVTPDLFDALTAVPQMDDGVLSTVYQLGDLARFAKVGLNPNSWFVNAASNSFHMSLNGLHSFDPRTHARLAQAMRAFLDYKQTLDPSWRPPTDVPPPTGGEWVRWLLEDGAFRRGMGADLAGGSEAAELARLFLKDPSASRLGMFGVARLMRKKMGTAYDMLDLIPRLATYMHLVERRHTALLRSGASPDVALFQARQYASKAVTDTFASTAQLGRAQRGASRVAGTIAPFAGWTMDFMRVLGTMGVGMAKGNKEAWGRAANAAIHTAFWGAAVPAASAALFGAPQDTKDAILREAGGLPEAWVSRTPFAAYVGRDAQKRPQFVSLRAFLPFEFLLQGKDIDRSPAAPAVALLRSLGGGALAEDNVDETLRALELFDTGRDTKLVRAPFAGEGLETLVGGLADKFTPGAVSSIYKAARRARLAEPRPADPQMSVAQALLAASPVSLEVAQPSVAAKTTLQGIGDVRSALGRIRGAVQAGIRDPRQVDDIMRRVEAQVAETQRRTQFIKPSAPLNLQMMGGTGSAPSGR